MDKKELIIVLQSCLFAIDGLGLEEIRALNPDYPKSLIQAGIRLSGYLRSIKPPQEVKK